MFLAVYVEFLYASYLLAVGVVDVELADVLPRLLEADVL
jgi:hypothetical protein